MTEAEAGPGSAETDKYSPFASVSFTVTVTATVSVSVSVTDESIGFNISNSDSDSDSLGQSDLNSTLTSTTAIVSVLRWYQQFHGFVSLFICVFSVATNILNIIVLTRPKMRGPINYLLSSLAAIDIAKMSAYFMFALNIFVLKRPDPVHYCFSKFEIIVFLLIAQNLVITLHLTSMIIAIMLALYRYIIMRSAVNSQRVLTVRGARLTLVAVVGLAVVLCSPNYITKTAYQPDAAVDAWWYNETEFAANYPDLSNSLCFYIYGLVGKVGGSIILVVLFGLLLATLREAAESSKKVRGKQDAAKREKEAAGQRRLTIMLVGIVLVFVVAELPQGVLLILSVRRDFFEQVYAEMGDFLDLLTMLSSSVNFILYCSMSRQFRDTFVELFVERFRRTVKLKLQGQTNRVDGSLSVLRNVHAEKILSNDNQETERLVASATTHNSGSTEDQISTFQIEVRTKGESTRDVDYLATSNKSTN